MYSVDARPCTSIALTLHKGVNMEGITVDEAVDTGEIVAVLDLDALYSLLLFGDNDQSAHALGQLVDYEAVTQETPPPTD
jgi:hypothetical protein